MGAWDSRCYSIGEANSAVFRRPFGYGYLSEPAWAVATEKGRWGIGMYRARSIDFRESSDCGDDRGAQKPAK